MQLAAFASRRGATECLAAPLARPRPQGLVSVIPGLPIIILISKYLPADLAPGALS